jgi:spermidine synthase
MYLDVESDLYFKYFEFFDIIGAIKADPKKALMIGGAAYVYPRHFLETFPESKMDVVEIDPDLITLAKKYFNLRDDPRLTVHHEDGRSFLNKAQNKKYDVIFGDAYKPDAGIPHQLTTNEAIQKMHDALINDGVVLINIFSNEPPLQSDFLRAEYKTFKSIFSQVYVFKGNPIKKIDEARQSIILMAVKSDDPNFVNPSDPTLSGYMAYGK